MITQMKHYKKLYGTYEISMHMHVGTGPSTDDKSLSANKSSSRNDHTVDCIKGTVTTINRMIVKVMKIIRMVQICQFSSQNV